MDSEELGSRYNQIAEWWNEEISKSKAGIEYVKKSARLAKKNSKVLDIGCGGGRFIEVLKKDFKIVGIDVSSEMIGIAKARHPNTTLINKDFYEWDTSGKFDFIIAWDSVFHAPAKLQKPITVKMCDLLHEGGILLFTAGGIEGEVNGTMEGVKFEYASLGYRQYLKILDTMNCKIILMERDQYPLDHMVFISQKLKGK